MEVILTKDSLAQATPNNTATIQNSSVQKGNKFEFIKGCWFITKKLFSLS